VMALPKKSAAMPFVIPAEAGIVRLRACMDSEVRVLVGHGALRPVIERKGVIERWGPKQREVNDQSVG
jgi:hypothetical protein